MAQKLPVTYNTTKFTWRLTLPTVLCISTNMDQLCLRVYKRRLVRRLNKLHQLEPFTFTSSELVCGHLTEASTKTVFENEQNIRVASQRARPKNAGTVSRTERCVSSWSMKICSGWSFDFLQIRGYDTIFRFWSIVGLGVYSHTTSAKFLKQCTL